MKIDAHTYIVFPLTLLFICVVVVVDISVGLSKNDPLFLSKKAYLDKSGRGVASVRFPLQRSRYPSELVDFLRLLLVEPEDLGMQVHNMNTILFAAPYYPVCVVLHVMAAAG